MQRRFNQLSIQGKLFVIFGFFILLAALVVGTNTYAVLHIAQGNARLQRIFTQLMESYTAMSLIQQLEGAERAYFISDDPSYLDELAEYSARVDTVLREAMLKAEDRNSKADVYALQQLKWSHDDTLEMLADAYNADDWNLYEVAMEQAGAEIEEMYTLVGRLIERDKAALARIDDATSLVQLAGLGLNAVTLILFVGLAAAAALIISVQVFRPILLVDEAVAALRGGAFDPHQLAPLSGRSDEIGALVRAFLGMAEATRRRREALEQEAAEIRAELAS
jgi:nitrogen fixation/metabolism regulation signal transduction histidine kinase